jgi:hypothetical protein
MRAWELFEPQLVGIECYDDAAAVAAGRRQVEGPGCVQWGGGSRDGWRGAVPPVTAAATGPAAGHFR